MIEVSPNVSVRLDGSGNGQVSIGPPSGAVWRLRLANVSTTGTASQPQCFLYRGSTSGPQEQIDSTYLGNSASSSLVAGAPFYQGQVLWAKWTGGDAGAMATLQAYGQQGRRGEPAPFDPGPLGPGFPLNVATVFRAGNTIINASGEFQYSPSPGFGNLVSSDTAAASTDQYGNAYLAGNITYTSAGGNYYAQQLLGFRVLYYTAPAASGPWTIQLAAGRATGGNQYDIFGPAMFLSTPADVHELVWYLPSGDTTGLTDLAQINAFLNAGIPVQLTAGPYYINGPIQMTKTGGSLYGPPSAPHKTSPAMPAVITLVSGSNSDMIQVTGRNCYIGNLELNGNKAGQTSGTNALIYLPSGSDWSVIERCFLHDGFYLGIHGDSAQAHKILDCSIQLCNNRGIYLPSTCADQTIRGCLIGQSGGDNVYTAAAITHILDCDIFSSSGGNGITVDLGATGTMITNTGIDRNAQSGIVVLTKNISIDGNTIHSNGQAATNTYASIAVDNTANPTTGVTIGRNTFWLDSGITNLPNYHIQYKNTATAKTHGNQFETGSSATGTISAASQVKDANETG